MGEITDIASTAMQTSQVQLQDQINMRVLKMALQADKDMANMLLKNVDQSREMPDSSEGHIDLYV